MSSSARTHIPLLYQLHSNPEKEEGGKQRKKEGSSQRKKEKKIYASSVTSMTGQAKTEPEEMGRKKKKPA